MIACLAGCATTNTYVDEQAISQQLRPISIALFIRGNDIGAAQLMNERLFNRLFVFSDFRPIERDKLTTIALANKINESGLSPELAREIGEKLQVDAVIVGNFMLYKTSHIQADVWDGSISIRLVRTTDFKTLWTADYSTDYAFAPFSSLVGVGTVVNYCSDAVIKSLKEHWN
jgi:hypothetical protein